MVAVGEGASREEGDLMSPGNRGKAVHAGETISTARPPPSVLIVLAGHRLPQLSQPPRFHAGALTEPLQNYSRLRPACGQIETGQNDCTISTSVGKANPRVVPLARFSPAAGPMVKATIPSLPYDQRIANTTRHAHPHGMASFFLQPG